MILSLITFVGISCGGRRQPNIVIITIDALRADHLSLYGYRYRTSPNIDKFASKALVYQNAFCALPKTSASLASMLTGLHPTVLKIKPNLGTLRKEFLTLAEALKEKGYVTGASVFNGNLDRVFGFAQGFDFYDEVWKRNSNDKEGSAALITEAAVDFIRKNKERKFFLWLHYIDPHAPYQPEEKWIPQEDKGADIRKVKNKVVVGEGEWVHLNLHPFSGYYISRYDGEIRKVDFYAGKVLEELKKSGLLKNTVVIISADHGEELGEHNLFFDHGPLPFNSSIRIPLVVYIPWEKPRNVKAPVSLMDLAPTIGEIVGIKFPYKLTGRSMLKPIKNRKLLILALQGNAVIDFPKKLIFIGRRAQKALGLKPFYLFDVAKDFQEKAPLPLQGLMVSRLTRLRDRLLHLYSKESRKFKGKKRGKRISRKTLENLKSLGYVK